MYHDESRWAAQGSTGSRFIGRDNGPRTRGSDDRDRGLRVPGEGPHWAAIPIRRSICFPSHLHLARPGGIHGPSCLARRLRRETAPSLRPRRGARTNACGYTRREPATGAGEGMVGLASEARPYLAEQMTQEDQMRWESPMRSMHPCGSRVAAITWVETSAGRSYEYSILYAERVAHH